ncbi:GNAT family N-acetyltransferase [Actinoplanes sp. NPDC049265]|uniref:GNAT family N-acetyltransferase n=1 Tax=Actinoplanes sp. NPDC049265 TaxID=3363902 RepID=UPI00371A3089
MLLRPATHVDEVADLWIALAGHHYAVDRGIGQLAEPVGAAESWPSRRRQYETWSAEPGWLLLVAEVDGEAHGYAAARITASASAWQVGDRIGHLETLAVAPDERGEGVGTALVTAVRDHWRRAGVRLALVSVLAGNDEAARFYQRLGAVEFTRTSVFPI